MTKLLCIRQENPDSFSLASDALGSRGIELRYLDAWRDEVPADARGLAGLVVLGGSMNVDQAADHPFLVREQELLRSAVALRVPTLGICLGAQLLADALGGRVHRSRPPILGFSSINRTGSGDEHSPLSVWHDGDMVLRWHAYSLEPPPSGATVLQDEAGEPQGFALEQAWAVQFHPEAEAAVLEGWLDAEGDSLEKFWGRQRSDVEAEIAKYLPRQQARAREMFDRFAGSVAMHAEAVSTP